MGGPYTEGETFCGLCGEDIAEGVQVVRAEKGLVLENEELREIAEYEAVLLHASCYALVDPIEELCRIKGIVDDAFGDYVQNVQLNAVDYGREVDRIAWAILKGRHTP